MPFVQPPPAEGRLPLPVVQDSHPGGTGYHAAVDGQGGIVGAVDRRRAMTVCVLEKSARRSDPDSAGLLEQFGALPWRTDRHGRPQVLLITSRTRGRWIVPKGWPMEGRVSYLAAALEAFEEAGVIGDIGTSPLGEYRYLRETRDGSLRRCRVALYPLRVLGTLTNWPERAQRRRKWLALADAAELVDDNGLARIIRAVRESPGMLKARDRTARPTDCRDLV